MKALVLDDEVDNANFIAEMFQDKGVETSVAYTFKEALDLLSNFYDILFIDHFLDGGKKGIDFIREYKQYHPSCDVTMYSGKEESIPLIERVVSKTIGYKQIESTLDEIITKVNNRGNEMGDSEKLEVAMLHICQRRREECFKILDDKYLTKEDFHEKMDTLVAANASNKRWLIGECIGVLIILFLTYEKNVDNLNAVDRKATSIEVTMKAGNSMLDIVSKQMDDLRKQVEDLRTSVTK